MLLSGANIPLPFTNPLPQEIRRKSTKDTQDAKEELQRKEQIKEAAAKRREKAEDQAAKDAIRRKIQADKDARKAKAEAEKAAREGRAPPPAAPAPAPAVASAPSTSKPASAYTETRLRLQTPEGNVMKSFPAEATLFEVAAAVTEEKGIEVQSFMLGYPKKTFDAVDFGASLRELGLVPSASLIVK